MPQYNTCFQYLGLYHKAYRTHKLKKEEKEKFIPALKQYLQELSNNSGGTEELLKSKLADFLKAGFNYFTEVGFAGENAKGGSSIDLCTKSSEHVKVIFETKGKEKTREVFTQNLSGGVDINHKALHETIYYFYAHIPEDERKFINHIVLTDSENFIFIDPKSFVNEKLKEACDHFIKGDLFFNKTRELYDELGKIIKNNKIDFNFFFFSITDVKEHLRVDELTQKNHRCIEEFYKLLHPNFLHREYRPVDRNLLNEKFYKELLYIFGLEEKKEDKVLKIVPIGNSKHTLYNQARAQLETDNHDQIVALLTLWLNRILFLKLFESQLVSFNNGAEEYKFFNSQKVKDANDLGTLFFFVLSTPVKDRIMDDLLENIPFLNSSLFERSPKENKFPVSAVLKEKLPLYPHSVLKDKKSRSFVTYILDFLDSYNFCETEEEDTRELISSSVLGLVFEKINGYKDGAFFTPSLVTEFMAKDVIDRVVLDKFNKIFQERAQCKNIEELENLLGYDRHKTERKKIYQATFDSIKICDPSCGSGHFLVSVLNYLVYLKSFLGLLPISNNIEIHNDLLFIADSTSTKQFKYLRGDVSTTEVQKVIFKTKAHLIKNCLFGADINAASVEICKLRLWIELLKNAYYIDNTEEMELLPNIDLNIVCGDSLSSMPHPGISTSLFVDPETVKKYKELFSDYRNGNYKKGKYADRDSLSVIKAELSEACSLTALNNFPVQWTIEFPDVLGKNGEFSGFDVVIGNPPYIQLQKDEGKLGKIYSKGSFVTFERKGDIYCLFFERSFYLLKEDGYLSFITSNKWLKADYGKKLRLFLSKADPQVLVDFKNLKIFDNASVDTSILVLKKSSSSEGTNSLVVNSEEELRNLPLLLDTNQNIIYFSNRGEEKWIILEPFEKSIFSKIQRLGVRLKTQGLTIQLGIKPAIKKRS